MELVIAIAIIVALASVVILSISGLRNDRDLDSDAKIAAAFLRDAQQRAITGEDDKEWGVYFTNTDNDFYELFKSVSSTSREVVARRNFKPTVELSSGSVEIKFKRISGKPVIGISFEIRLKSDNSKTKLIQVTDNGAIKY